MRKNAKHHSGDSVRSVVHIVAGQLQHQSGSVISVSCGVGSSCKIVWIGDDGRRRTQFINTFPFRLSKEGIFNVIERDE